MKRNIPDKLVYFFKNALTDLDDGYEYASELNRILNSDECQKELKGKEIEALRDFAENVKKIGEFTCYTGEKIKAIETEHFGSRGVLGYLGFSAGESKPKWPF